MMHGKSNIKPTSYLITCRYVVRINENIYDYKRKCIEGQTTTIEPKFKHNKLSCRTELINSNIALLTNIYIEPRSSSFLYKTQVLLCHVSYGGGRGFPSKSDEGIVVDSSGKLMEMIESCANTVEEIHWNEHN
jgi:hypothetical protein